MPQVYTKNFAYIEDNLFFYLKIPRLNKLIQTNPLWKLYFTPSQNMRYLLLMDSFRQSMPYLACIYSISLFIFHFFLISFFRSHFPFMSSFLPPPFLRGGGALCVYLSTHNLKDFEKPAKDEQLRSRLRPRLSCLPDTLVNGGREAGQGTGAGISIDTLFLTNLQ